MTVAKFSYFFLLLACSLWYIHIFLIIVVFNLKHPFDIFLSIDCIYTKEQFQLGEYICLGLSSQLMSLYWTQNGETIHAFKHMQYPRFLFRKMHHSLMEKRMKDMRTCEPSLDGFIINRYKAEAKKTKRTKIFKLRH